MTVIENCHLSLCTHVDILLTAQHSWKKWVPFLFDDKTGNRTSTAAYQNTRH